MPIYEIQVTRRVESEDTATVMVRAKRRQLAVAKAMRAVRKEPDKWFGPVGTETSMDIDNVERLNYIPDCEVLS